MSELLTVSSSNIKLEKNPVKVYSVSLPAGVSCPFAKGCKAWISEDDELIRGPDSEIDCFAARMEQRFPLTHASWARNLEKIKDRHGLGGIEGVVSLMADSITSELTRDERAGIDPWFFRPHVGGGMFKKWYFEAYLTLAEINPTWRIYFYTKAIPYLIQFRERIEATPNFIPNASRGGTHDHLIEESGVRSVAVVWSEKEAADMGLEIDRNDSLASNPLGGDFAVLLHGLQQPGSAASTALKAIKRAKRLTVLQGVA